jgi:hypothetical protein
MGVKMKWMISLPVDADKEFYQKWPEQWPLFKEICLSGDEVLEHEPLWEIFDYFGDQGGTKGVKLSVYSPLSADFSKVERFTMKSHYVNDLRFCTTVPAEGREEWLRKLQLLLDFGKMSELQIDGDEDVIAELRAKFRPGFIL